MYAVAGKSVSTMHAEFHIDAVWAWRRVWPAVAGTVWSKSLSEGQLHPSSVTDVFDQQWIVWFWYSIYIYDWDSVCYRDTAAYSQTSGSVARQLVQSYCKVLFSVNLHSVTQQMLFTLVPWTPMSWIRISMHDLYRCASAQGYWSVHGPHWGKPITSALSR